MATYRIAEADRERVRYPLGWVNVEPVSSFSLGFPSSCQEALMVERAMDRLMTRGAIQRVLDILDTMDCIETKQREAIGKLGVQQIGEIKFRNSNDEGTVNDLLEQELTRWRMRLASQLGVQPAPGKAGGTPINRAVRTLV